MEFSIPQTDCWRLIFPTVSHLVSKVYGKLDVADRRTNS